MQMCLNPYVPGWMVVPWKPHPFGNEYHTICDGEFGLGNLIMWHVELQEGKDWLAKAGPKKWSNLGKTVSIMESMHKTNAHQGKACTMDSVFCMSMGIVQLEARLGVYGQALIKQRGKNWPKGMPGTLIDENFYDKPLGYCKTLRVKFNDNPLYIHCMNEEKYVTKSMSTFGTLDKVPSHKTKQFNGFGICGVLLPQASVMAQPIKALGG